MRLLLSLAAALMAFSLLASDAQACHRRGRRQSGGCQSSAGFATGGCQGCSGGCNSAGTGGLAGLTFAGYLNGQPVYFAGSSCAGCAGGNFPTGFLPAPTSGFVPSGSLAPPAGFIPAGALQTPPAKAP